jgi:hypothetical protein
MQLHGYRIKCITEKIIKVSDGLGWLRRFCINFLLLWGVIQQLKFKQYKNNELLTFVWKLNTKQ